MPCVATLKATSFIQFNDASVVTCLREPERGVAAMAVEDGAVLKRADHVVPVPIWMAVQLRQAVDGQPAYRTGLASIREYSGSVSNETEEQVAWEGVQHAVPRDGIFPLPTPASPLSTVNPPSLAGRPSSLAGRPSSLAGRNPNRSGNPPSLPPMRYVFQDHRCPQRPHQEPKLSLPECGPATPKP